MEEHQIIRCTQDNCSKLDKIQELIEELYDIDGVDKTNVDGIIANLVEIRTETLRAQYEAEIRYYQNRLAAL